ncbi:hypothetical protein D918_06476 [Trichuris suis]|nr:hypothetical protein D918_06476 [Trichuris suis]
MRLSASIGNGSYGPNSDSQTSLTPIRSILRTIVQPVDTYAQLEHKCVHIRSYRFCLVRCADSLPRKILNLGLNPWLFICRRESIENLSIFLPCLTYHSAAMTDDCSDFLDLMSASVRDLLSVRLATPNSMRKICRSQDQFERCFVSTVARHCASATSFFQMLSQISRASLLEMWQLYLGSEQDDLPRECLRLRIKRYETRASFEESNELSEPTSLGRVSSSSNGHTIICVLNHLSLLTIGIAALQAL